MASRNPNTPNIVFILTDDQGPWAMNCAGTPELETPNLDGLAASGLRFDNLFCASPVCSPARASILTGRIPSFHGVHDWIRQGSTTDAGDGKLIQYLDGITGYTDVLSANGYTCGISGKWHLGDSHHVQKGFDYWNVHSRGGGAYYNAPMMRGDEVYEEPEYVTDYIANNGISFIDQQAANDTPFYLSVHYTAPHSPWDRENHPKDLWDRYRNECDFASMPREPRHPWQINTAPQGWNEDERRDKWAGYFASITAMDAGVGRIVDSLDSHGLREDTLVVFTSDNGMNMGHHGLFGKGNASFPQNMYDTSVKVPGIISRPGHVPAGQVRQELVSHLDIMPTLLDYTGMANPVTDEMPGHSFAALLRGESFEQREDVVVFDEYGPVRMIRTREWKYVHRFAYGPHELYDLVDDPGECVNRFDDPVCESIIREMRGRLSEWFLRYTDPARDASKEPVTGSGQLDLAGPAGKGQEAFFGGDDVKAQFHRET
jgi:choline-sulfatase